MYAGTCRSTCVLDPASVGDQGPCLSLFVRLIMSTRAVLRACFLYRLLPYLPQVGGSTALSRTIWIDAQRQSYRVRRSPVVKLR